MHLRIGGVTMGGRSGPLIITDFTRPVTEKRGEFTDRLHGHGQESSRQWLGGRTWSWTLATNGHSLEESVEMAESVEKVWLDRAYMGATDPVPLEYSLDDGRTWSRVYGRMGRVTSMTPDVRAMQGVGLLDLEFLQTDPRHFSSELHRTEITATQAEVGGWVFPLEFPITTVHTGQARAGSLFNGGDLPAPVTVTFYGPFSQASVTTGTGYRLTYTGPVAWDQYVVVDPVAQTVLLNGKRSVPGRLGVHSRLGDLTVPPGHSEWLFQATDLTGTARAALAWRDSYTSMQYGGA